MLNSQFLTEDIEAISCRSINQNILSSSFTCFVGIWGVRVCDHKKTPVLNRLAPFPCSLVYVCVWLSTHSLKDGNVHFSDPLPSWGRNFFLDFWLQAFNVLFNMRIDTEIGDETANLMESKQVVKSTTDKRDIGWHACHRSLICTWISFVSRQLFYRICLWSVDIWQSRIFYSSLPYRPPCK